MFPSHVLRLRAELDLMASFTKSVTDGIVRIFILIAVAGFAQQHTSRGLAAPVSALCLVERARQRKGQGTGQTVACSVEGSVVRHSILTFSFLAFGNNRIRSGVMQNEHEFHFEEFRVRSSSPPPLSPRGERGAYNTYVCFSVCRSHQGALRSFACTPSFP